MGCSPSHVELRAMFICVVVVLLDLGVVVFVDMLCVTVWLQAKAGR